jgi:hypothetical protein
MSQIKKWQDAHCKGAAPSTLSGPLFEWVAPYVFTIGCLLLSGGYIFMSRGIVLPTPWDFTGI